MSKVLREYLDKASDLTKNKLDFVTVILVFSEGHVPQNTGAKIIVDHKGLYWGTVGGGKVEAKAITHAQNMLLQKQLLTDFKRWDLQQDLGMSCGGSATFFFEVNCKVNWNIAVFGAGHVSQELVPLLSKFDCEITCIDTREDWLCRIPDISNVQKILSPNMPSEVEKFSPSTFFVLVTQGHSTDLPILKQILLSETLPPYVGVIGSKVKARSLRAALLRDGYSQEKTASFFCPMGLPIGNNSPAEIAVSIASQLLEIRDKK